MNMTATWILYIKNEESNPIRHDLLPILKYTCIIDYNMLSCARQSLFVFVCMENSQER